MVDARLRLSETATWGWTVPGLAVSLCSGLLAVGTELTGTVEGYAALAVPALMGALAYSLGALLGQDGLPMTRPLPMAALFFGVWGVTPSTILFCALA